jgi:heme/copper-type cytochrome/quinol oxidase subunit 2
MVGLPCSLQIAVVLVVVIIVIIMLILLIFFAVAVVFHLSSGTCRSSRSAATDRQEGLNRGILDVFCSCPMVGRGR